MGSQYLNASRSEVVSIYKCPPPQKNGGPFRAFPLLKFWAQKQNF